jgi:putative membrane protein
MRRTVIATAALIAATSLTLVATASARRADPIALSPVLAAPATAAALDDATIVAIFDAANTADVETGQLAAERGHSKEVRDFGAMLVRDHKAVRQMGRDLATKLGVTPTPPADDASAKAHATALATLRAKRGAAFDHAFLQHEAAFHKSVIDAVQTTLLPAIQNEELKALVVKVAPAFQAHMVAAQNLDKQLADKSSTSDRYE